MLVSKIDLRGDRWTPEKIAVVIALPRDIQRLIRAVGIDEDGCGFWIALWRENDVDARLVLDFLQLVEAELAREEDEETVPMMH
jgi:hypothetical protein